MARYISKGCPLYPTRPFFSFLSRGRYKEPLLNLTPEMPH